MADGDPFVDHYDILGVDPNCDARALEAAYHLLAKAFHPDHSETADVSKFTEVVAAYTALKNPTKRAKYDLHYASMTGFVFAPADQDAADQTSAVSDADAHAKILMLLYKKRREQARDAGVGRYFVHKILNCSDEIFEFHLWYLKEKGFIVTTEQGELAITIEGVDHVISMSQTAMREKLLLTQRGVERGPTAGSMEERGGDDR